MLNSPVGVFFFFLFCFVCEILAISMHPRFLFLFSSHFAFFTIQMLNFSLFLILICGIHISYKIFLVKRNEKKRILFSSHSGFQGLCCLQLSCETRYLFLLHVYNNFRILSKHVIFSSFFISFYIFQ